MARLLPELWGQMRNTMNNTTRNWSAYQQAIFDKVSNPTFGSFTVNAVAGSGKTTTIVECANRVGNSGLSILFLAFNKSIVNELRDRLPNSVDCKTLHSHGYRALMRAVKGRIVTDDNKWLDYIKTNLSVLSCTTFSDTTEGELLKNGFISNCKNLLNKCRVNLVKTGEIRRIGEIAEHFGFDLVGDEIEVVSTCLATAYRLDTTIDFVDMITTSVFSAKRFIPRYDLIFVDEAQDLNKAQQELLLASLAPNGRFVAVGDPMQAINGFAGADCDSFANLTRIANNHELPLSVCYRCGKAQIDLAKQYVPYLTAFDGACDGEVKHTNRFDGLMAGDMVLCRKSAPLVGLCLKMIANGISANVKGRDICEGLKTLVSKTKARTIAKLLEKLDHEIDLARNRAERKGLDASTASFVVTLQDKVACIEIIAGTCSSVAEVLEKLDTLFSDNINGNVVTLSTIHKAKGLESNNVWIVVPDKLPLRFKGQQNWEYQQELNLCYVAYTRAKKVLTFVDLNEDELASYQF